MMTPPSSATRPWPSFSGFAPPLGFDVGLGVMAMLFVAPRPGEEAERRLCDRMVDTLLNSTDPT